MRRSKPRRPDAAGPAPMEVCPVCQRPAHGGPDACVLFRTLTSVRLDEDAEKNKAKKSRLLRNFHANICKKCYRDASVCHEKKLNRFLAELEKGIIYYGPKQLQENVSLQPCVTLSLCRFTPLPCSWYVPEGREGEKGAGAGKRRAGKGEG